MWSPKAINRVSTVNTFENIKTTIFTISVNCNVILHFKVKKFLLVGKLGGGLHLSINRFPLSKNAK